MFLFRFSHNEGKKMKKKLWPLKICRPRQLPTLPACESSPDIFSITNGILLQRAVFRIIVCAIVIPERETYTRIQKDEEIQLKCGAMIERGTGRRSVAHSRRTHVHDKEKIKTISGLIKRRLRRRRAGTAVLLSPYFHQNFYHKSL